MDDAPTERDPDPAQVQPADDEVEREGRFAGGSPRWRSVDRESSSQYSRRARDLPAVTTDHEGAIERDPKRRDRA